LVLTLAHRSHMNDGCIVTDIDVHIMVFETRFTSITLNMDFDNNQSLSEIYCREKCNWMRFSHWSL
jgi:hypothetical protein